MREHLFQLPADSDANLQTRIREMLVSLILDGHLPPGSPLPSGRSLARQLHVARNTVVLAYQHLVDEGFVVSRERSGYFVSDEVDPAAAGPVAGSAGQPAAVDWNRRLRVRPSRQRNIAKPGDWQQYRYPFVYGQFDPALFPVQDWRECSRDAATVAAIHDWAKDRIDQDDPELVEQIHTRILPRRGVWAQPDEILVTVGAQQALFLLADLLLGPRSTVGIEEPGYPDVRNMFSLRTERVLALAVDAAGVRVEEGIGDCDCVYVTPSHQFPTTVTMSRARRRLLLEAAARHDFLIIEDDYESELNFVGEPTPALKSLDQSGHVIYVGSLSKTLAPGLRMGFMVAPADLIREARALRRLMMRHPPANNQLIVARFLKRGHHDSLVRRLSHAYRERWEIMGRALARYLPDSSQSPAFGGSSYWVRGPAGLDCRELQAVAARRGVLIEPGDVFFLRDPPPRNCFRLGFASISANRIEAGIAELAAIIDTL
jgi:GntR family transcriptional regulator/MocR family aminotransferase